MADESFWGLLELMGHRRLAGKITRDDGGLIRIDIPDGCTQWYGTGAVYAITPMSEETARAAASQLNHMARLSCLGAPPRARRPARSVAASASCACRLD